MTIKEDNYLNFYLGNSAEHFISSKIFFHGYEAHKYSPDFGFDLCATNKARAYFRGEKEKTFEIQVKASYLRKNNEAIFSINKSEIDFLENHSNSILIFCIYRAKIYPDPHYSRNKRYMEGYFQEQNITSYRQHVFYQKYQNDMDREASKTVNIDEFEVELFWLNQKQIKLARDTFFYPYTDQQYIIKTFIGEHGKIQLKTTGKNKEEGSGEHYLMEEVRSLGYLLNGCACEEELKDGAFINEI